MNDKWISVKDALPPFGEKVYVTVNYQLDMFSMAHLKYDGSYEFNHVPKVEVVYWRKVPEKLKGFCGSDWSNGFHYRDLPISNEDFKQNSLVSKIIELTEERMKICLHYDKELNSCAPVWNRHYRAISTELKNLETLIEGLYEMHKV